MLLNWDQGTLYPAVVDAYFTRLGWRLMPDDIEAKIETFEAKMKLLNDHLLAVSCFQQNVFLDINCACKF